MGHYVAGMKLDSLYGESYEPGEPVDTSSWSEPIVQRLEKTRRIVWKTDEPGRGRPTPAPEGVATVDSAETMVATVEEEAAEDGADDDAEAGDKDEAGAAERSMTVYHAGGGAYKTIDGDETIEESGKKAVLRAGYEIVDRP